MVINKRKSGILNLNSRVPLTGERDGYPLVKSYKYLGTNLNNKLSIETHIKEAERKICFLNLKLRPILLRGHLKLNVNLFKVFVLPQYRLMSILSRFIQPREILQVEKSLRKRFKVWNSLPQSTPTYLIEMLIGGNIKSMG
jgi:hypothetical protein